MSTYAEARDRCFALWRAQTQQLWLELDGALDEAGNSPRADGEQEAAGSPVSSSASLTPIPSPGIPPGARSMSFDCGGTADPVSGSRGAAAKGG